MADTAIHAEGVNQLLRTLSRMGREVSDHARDASSELADHFLRIVRRDASSPAESAAVGAFKVYRDRVPKVGYPASRSAGVSGGAKAGELFPGTEFGGRTRTTTQQFPPKNPDGYVLYPVLRGHGEELALDWFEAIFDELASDWNRGAASV